MFVELFVYLISRSQKIFSTNIDANDTSHFVLKRTPVLNSNNTTQATKRVKHESQYQIQNRLSFHDDFAPP